MGVMGSPAGRRGVGRGRGLAFRAAKTPAYLPARVVDVADDLPVSGAPTILGR